MMTEREKEGEEASIGAQRVVLEKEYEFRFEVDFGATATIQLIHGTAESFGTELAVERKYKFSGTNGAIFTWHGCTLEVSSNAKGYLATETPMLMYANLHSLLEDARLQARNNGTSGPTIMLVGPTDSGKSSLSKLLLGYAARMGAQPTFVDLDIGQGAITVPGVISATPIDKPIDIEEGLSAGIPLAYFYGHVSLDENPDLYKIQVSRLAESLEKRKADNPEVRIAGTIVNTCGWVDGLGYRLLLDAIDIMKADHIAVIDHERLYSDLTQEYRNKSNIKILKLAKSGGVVTRPVQFRRKTRMNKVREYFYGISGDLCPHSTILDFKDVLIYQIGGGPAAPLSALPIGAKPTRDPVALHEIEPSAALLHSVVAVSHAEGADALLLKNVAGFLYITDVNMERQKITVLAPCPGALPSKYIIVGSLKWLE